jgi:DNA-binding CsgD family transcriptional regulator/tetratricopeptide (TPR) repeat protein
MSRLTPLLSPLLVGRDDLLDLADRRLEEAAGGRGQTLLLAGEAGVGKSRLLGAIARKAQGGGFGVVYGAVAPQDRDVPAASLLDLARSMIRQPRFAELGSDLLRLRAEANEAGSRGRRMLVLDIVDRILRAAGTPMLLAFEDLQWTDDLSLEILGELARSIRGGKILVVGAYRSDELPAGTLLREWRARLLTQRLGEEMRVLPLTLEQTALMTTVMLATGLPAPRTVVDAVFERTDGIPLFIEELLGAIGDEARSDDRAIREASVPATIEDAVLARFARLSAEGRAVAQAGAVIGRCFNLDVLAGVMDVPVATLDQPIQELIDQAFLWPPGPREVYDFRHQLLRDVMYQNLPSGALRRYHARVGEFGGELEGASEIHASVHFERAGLRVQAYRAAVAGAQEAARLSSHREAYELYRRAIDNMPASLEPAEHAALLEAYGDEAAAIDLHEQAETAATAARALYLEAGLPVKAARQFHVLAAVARRECRPLQIRSELVTRGLQELEPLPPSPENDQTRGWLIVEQAIVRLDRMEIESARESINAALALASRTANHSLAADARSVLGMIDVVSGDIEGGLDRIVALAHESQRTGLEDPALGAYRDAATVAVRVMRYRIAGESIEQGVQFADSVQQSHCRHVMRAASAQIAWADGRWDDALSRGGQELADKGCSRGAIGAELAVGFVAFGRGRLAEARDLLGRASTAAEASGNLELILPGFWGLAETELLDDHPELAFERCETAFELASHGGERALLAPFAVTGVRALLAAGRPEAAERWTTSVAAYLGCWAPVIRPAVDHATGLVKLASGSTVQARDLLEAAVRSWHEIGRIWEATWARVDLASCLLRSNRYAEAATVLATARETAMRLDSAPLRARIEELSGTVRRHGSFDEPWRPLTTREFEVARLIADGLTNAEIAGELSIAPKTASAHVEHILAKLGVARRAEIATWAATVARPADKVPAPRQGVIAHR